MRELKTVQKNLDKKAKEMHYQPFVKFWPWEELIINKAGNDFGIKTNDGVNLIKFSQAGKFVKGKLLKLLIQNNYSKLQLEQLSRGEFYVMNIPPGKESKLDFVNSLSNNWESLFILVGAGAKLTVIDKIKKNKQFGFMSVFILAGKNSQVDYLIKNRTNNSSFAYQGFLKESARINFYLDAKINSGYNYHSVVLLHQGQGSEGNILARYDIGGEAKNFLDLQNLHKSKNGRGDIVIKALAKGRSKSKLDGWVKIEKKVFNVDSYLKQDVLLLSDLCEVDAQPNLEILNNDVKASHGTTLGYVDENQLHYLMSRGFSQAQAKKIIATGFINSLNAKIKNKEIKNEFLK